VLSVYICREVCATYLYMWFVSAYDDLRRCECYLFVCVRVSYATCFCGLCTCNVRAHTTTWEGDCVISGCFCVCVCMRMYRQVSYAHMNVFHTYILALIAKICVCYCVQSTYIYIHMRTYMYDMKWLHLSYVHCLAQCGVVRVLSKYMYACSMYACMYVYTQVFTCHISTGMHSEALAHKRTR